MLFEGFILGTMSAFCMALMFNRFPGKMQVWISQHPLLAEGFMVVSFYMIMGTSVTAHIAAAVMSMESFAAMHVFKNKPEFLWIHAGIDRAKQSLSGFSDKLKKINEEYKAKHNVLDVSESMEIVKS